VKGESLAVLGAEVGLSKGQLSRLLGRPLGVRSLGEASTIKLPTDPAEIGYAAGIEHKDPLSLVTLYLYDQRIRT
jgi:hypothetical protein